MKNCKNIMKIDVKRFKETLLNNAEEPILHNFYTIWNDGWIPADITVI